MNWVDHSYPMRLGGAGPCHICGNKYEEGWFDEMGNPTCNSCKEEIDRANGTLDDGELMDVLGGNDYWDMVRNGIEEDISNNIVLGY